MDNYIKLKDFLSKLSADGEQYRENRIVSIGTGSVPEPCWIVYLESDQKFKEIKIQIPQYSNY